MDDLIKEDKKKVDAVVAKGFDHVVDSLATILADRFKYFKARSDMSGAIHNPFMFNDEELNVVRAAVRVGMIESVSSYDSTHPDLWWIGKIICKYWEVANRLLEVTLSKIMDDYPAELPGELAHFLRAAQNYETGIQYYRLLKSVRLCTFCEGIPLTQPVKRIPIKIFDPSTRNVYDIEFNADSPYGEFAFYMAGLMGIPCRLKLTSSPKKEKSDMSSPIEELDLAISVITKLQERSGTLALDLGFTCNKLGRGLDIALTALRSQRTVFEQFGSSSDNRRREP